MASFEEQRAASETMLEAKAKEYAKAQEAYTKNGKTNPKLGEKRNELMKQWDQMRAEHMEKYGERSAEPGSASANIEPVQATSSPQ